MDYKERRARDIFLAVAKSASLILMWLLAAVGIYRYLIGFILEFWGFFPAAFFFALGITLLAYFAVVIYSVIRTF